MRRLRVALVVSGVLVAVAGAAWLLPAQEPGVDLVFSNGKIITVDDRFSIAEAVAVRGERIVAVGTDEEIAALAGSATRRIDLAGKAVVPGLIDNHGHYMRAGLTWQREVRLDGVDSRRAALDLVRARAETAGPGEWIFTLGGWTTDQFADDPRPFTREELDEVAPDHPVLLQAAYYQTYLNSRVLAAAGIDERAPEADWVVRDANGRPTGVIEEAGVRTVVSHVPESTPQQIEAGTRAMIADLNRAGLTAVGNFGGCMSEDLFREWARQGRLDVRTYCFNSFAANSPQEVDQILPRIRELRLFQGDSSFDANIGYGEGVYGPASDNMLHVRPNQRPEDFAQWRRIATEIAMARQPLHVHSTLEATIDGFLDQIELIHREYPITNLRWALAHLDQLNAAQLERMKALGMYAAVHARPPILGAVFQRIHGDRDVPALRLIQDSGIQWGLGTDGAIVAQYRPFTTLWWAVTGRMVGGQVVNRQPIDREDALIAHTRKNAFFIFQENNLGSIQPGKLADLVVLDRDYLTVPADEIKDIQPVLTLVGGRVVYESDGLDTPPTAAP